MIIMVYIQQTVDFFSTANDGERVVDNAAI